MLEGAAGPVGGGGGVTGRSYNMTVVTGITLSCFGGVFFSFFLRSVELVVLHFHFAHGVVFLVEV